MPAVHPTILFAKFEQSLSAGGWQSLRTSSEHQPRDYRIWRGGERLDLKVYLLTLTPGGTGRPKDEWRIQPTAAKIFAQGADYLTVILGYDEDRDVFAGFDVKAHAGPLGTSPSIQIKAKALDAAVATGLALHVKSSAELVFAIKPGFLGLYIEYLRALHDAKVDPAELTLLVDMTSDPTTVSQTDIDGAVTTPERKRVLRTILRYLRDRRFRAKVLTAYAHQCAACGIQLELLDAAHVLPVGQPGSTDETPNGVAFCALHHRAYDAGLIAFNTSYELRISKPRMAQLKTDGRDGGGTAFAATLKAALLLPSKPSDHPDAALINKANAHRGFVFS
ncbi:hypothetical protein DA69_04355 [Brevundimonas naejangsanensis]|uniref:Uncharacterized protein n=1 Tax=Brevundimonas naejangsanensis TaxID=588932 RepID=A0A172Y4A5_9CAUL|nr:HNH endonuclease [Brevundimonas naejangsanensis]ANF54040.1 hypothetical protein DA69_04355 [Brevundimonas naejangsanensis]